MSKPLRVLILEDRPADAELMVYELRQRGFAPYWRRVETEAEFVDSLDPGLDVILADYSLPQFDALRALRRLQELDLDIPFIVVTATVSEEAAVECMRQGAADYLLKDRLSRLGLAVQHALAARETREEKRRAEEELRQAKADLERRVAERTTELRQVNERLTLELFERQRVEDNLRFLVDASRILASSLDYETTFTSLARRVVPHLADCCIIDVVEEDGSVNQLAIAHVDPARIETVREIRRCHPIDPNSAIGVPKVLRTGQPEIYPIITQAQLTEDPRSVEHLRMCGALDARSEMIVPLVARKRVLGAITFVLAGSMRYYGPSDLGMAMELANRAAMALDNARLFKQAREAISLRDQFLSSISHDLRNPLTSIKGMTQLVIRQLKQWEEPKTERMLESLQTIERNVTRMNALISELLDIARLQVGQTLDLHKGPTDLVALVRQIASEHQQLTRHHQIVVEANAREVIGNWDAMRLERAIGNLLSNAIKFSPDGGQITVTVGCEGQGSDTRATLSVQDQGIGIPADDLPVIFQPFTRARNAQQVGGTGVGLASAHQIVERHGGSITVTSEVGKGSTFIVTLPLTVPTSDR